MVSGKCSEDILRREFLIDEEPSSPEAWQSLLTQLRWQGENNAYEYGQKMLVPAGPMAKLIAHYKTMETAIMERLARPSRKWHKFGNENCYHHSEDWQPPITSLVAVARIATDWAFHK